METPAVLWSGLPDHTEYVPSVYDASGRIVYDQTAENNQIDLSHCLNGMYVVKLTRNNESVSKKLVLY